MLKLRELTLVSLLTVAVAVGCSSSDQAAIDKAVSTTITADQPAAAAATATSEAAIDKAVSATLPADQQATAPSQTPQTASAITHPPADMSNVNGMHDILRSEEAYIRFGTQADPSTVTLGPTDGGIPDYPPYEGKNSLNFKIPLMTPIISPINMEFVGFKNRSASFRQDNPDSPRQEPYDDLELCFESVSADWPGMIMCVYHLHTSPLLRSHLSNDDCGIREKWTTGTASEKGRIYYLENSSDRSQNSPESCDPLLGTILKRGDLLGYSGQVGNNPHSGFRFKVKSDKKNPLTKKGDPYLHWVQPSAFFYWQCFDSDTEFQPGILAYPFDCKLLDQQTATIVPTVTPTPEPPATPAPEPAATTVPTQKPTDTLTATLAPAADFQPSLEESYEVSVEEAVVYGTGGTLDGGEVELLLDLAIPDTGTDGPRPLLVHIHGGGFQTGNRWSQFNVAKRGWVAASIDYRLAGDEPLPGPRVKPFFDAVGGKSSSARDRSVVASVEDTLVALDYLLSRADELNIDTDRIVLKGESAGAFIALNVAYCADKFENSGPRIAAVIDFAGGISETFCGGGTAIDPDEAAVFIAHGTADATVSFTDRALSIVDGATAAGITYEFHPLEGVSHDWLLGMLGQTNADGRKIDDLMYEFLNRVLYDR